MVIERFSQTVINSGIFKFYIVEMLKRTYPDGIPSNIDGDSRMNNDEPRHKGK